MTRSETVESQSKFGLGFTSLEEEIAVDNLPVRGDVPSWLSGTLVRNGPAKFEVGTQNFRHWFDGLAMLHKFSFKDGKVSYANKFIQSNAYNKAKETGKISFSEFATDPCRSIFSRVQSMYSPKHSDNANVNVTRLGNRFLALTEIPIPIEFDPETLKTAGVFDPPNPIPGQMTTAHPHYDFARKEAYNYTTHMARQSSYNIYRIASGSEKEDLVSSQPAGEPSYMHSFGMSENYVILAEYPLVLNPLAMLMGGKPFAENLQWKSERGTTFVVVDKRDGRLVGNYHGAAFFAFHHVNAFEKEGDLIVDIIGYNDASIIRSLYLDILRGVSPEDIPMGELRRYRIPLKGGEANYEVLSKEGPELPRINYKGFNGKEYRYAYATGSSGPRAFADKLLKIDVQNVSTKEWSEAGCYPGEAVFISKPNATAEDDGLILSVILDSGAGNSFLLILDAGSFTEVARAGVPHHIPFGLHGQYYESVGKPSPQA
jgi:beta,beta-carotene 9',10'-dioxygenase